MNSTVLTAIAISSGVIASVVFPSMAQAEPLPFPEEPMTAEAVATPLPFPESGLTEPLPTVIPGPEAMPTSAIALPTRTAIPTHHQAPAKNDAKVEFLSLADLATDKTSAIALTSYSTNTMPTAPTTATTAPPEVAQVNRNLFVNRPWSYVGAGLNLGLEGDTDLGDTSFAIISKIAIGDNLSLRPGAIIGENVAILVPVTYDFTVPNVDPFEAALLRPYVGGGVVFTTNDTAADEGVDNNVGPMITGGLDVRFNDKWVANAGLNVGFLGDDAEFGIVIGVGYIFSNR
jgi:hypothetical protein